MTGESARLFVALELPDVAVTALKSWADARLAAVPGLRRVDDAGLHVTLCFLGSQPVGEIGAIAAGCRRALAGRNAVRLQIGAPVWLPHRRPRVLAVALEDGSGLGELQAALAGELTHGGWYGPEKRPFLPHVTVGRFGRAGGRAVDVGTPAPVTFAGASITLLRSRLGPGGSRYEPLARVDLGAGAEEPAACSVARPVGRALLGGAR